VIFTNPGLYTVQLTVESESGSDTEIKTDYINTVDILTVIVTAIPKEVCLNNIVELHANVGGGTGNYSFEWTSSPAGFSSSEQNPVVYPEESTEYTVTVSDGNSNVEDNVFVTVYPLPTIELGDWPDYLCNEQEPPVQLTADPEGGVYNGNVTPDGLFEPEAAQLGWNAITYIYVDENGCEASAQDSIFVDECVGIKDYEEEIAIKIYPNPTRDILNINIDGLRYSSNTHIRLVDVVGQLVYEHAIMNQNGSYKTAINLAAQQNGLYILKLSIGSRNFYKKVFLSR